jgi:hypothetical protein
MQSFYDFYANAHNIGLSLGSDAGTAHVLAYTASIGGGITATISAETGDARRGLLDSPAGWAGHALPDIVANIRYEQAWGAIQLSGALHQIRDANPAVDTEYGFAGQIGARFNLPMIAAGDNLVIQAAYADGASSYTGAQLGLVGRYRTAVANILQVVAGDVTIAPDATLVNGNLDTVKSWSTQAAFQHFWNPKLFSAAYFGYSSFDVPMAGNGEWNVMQAGLQTSWSPVRGLLLGAQVNYTRTELGRAMANTVGFNNTSADAWSGRVRIQRDF